MDARKLGVTFCVHDLSPGFRNNFACFGIVFEVGNRPARERNNRKSRDQVNHLAHGISGRLWDLHVAIINCLIGEGSIWVRERE